MSGTGSLKTIPIYLFILYLRIRCILVGPWNALGIRKCENDTEKRVICWNKTQRYEG